MHTFPNYQEWHSAITGPCGLTLSRDYCAERIKELENKDVLSTRAFLDAYGAEYLETVILWFRQAQSEALS